MISQLLELKVKIQNNPNKQITTIDEALYLKVTSTFLRFAAIHYLIA